MFENMAFGMFENMAFGSTEDLTGFKPLPQPREKNPDYEKFMIKITQAALDYMAGHLAETPPLANAGVVMKAIREFANYWRMMYQDQHLATTPEAAAFVYKHLFGGFTNYVKLNKFFGDQQKAANYLSVDVKQSVLSENQIKVDSAKNKFFEEKVFPIARDKKLDNDKLQFLGEVFLDRSNGDVSASELSDALTMIMPYISPSDLGSVLVFGPKLVLGLDLGAGSLHSNIPNATLAMRTEDIKSKYNAIRSRLGPFADPNMDATFSNFIKASSVGSMEFKGADLTLFQMYINSVGRAITGAFGRRWASSAEEQITSQASHNVAQKMINKLISDPFSSSPSLNSIQKDINDESRKYVERNWNSKQAMSLIGIAALLWFVNTRK